MPQIQSSTEFSDNLEQGLGFFGAFCAIFRAPPVVPGVERQFFELSSAHTSRAPGVPESPGVLLPGDSAPGLCQLALVTCSGYTLEPSSTTNNNNHHQAPVLFKVTSPRFRWSLGARGPSGWPSLLMAARDDCRRGERRLRACLNYARMSVAMALSESQYHSAQRQRTARVREEEC